MEMRKYRMRLIQTKEQLKFSYVAIVVGGTKDNLWSTKASSRSGHYNSFSVLFAFLVITSLICIGWQTIRQNIVIFLSFKLPPCLSLRNPEGLLELTWPSTFLLALLPQLLSKRKTLKRIPARLEGHRICIV